MRVSPALSSIRSQCACGGVCVEVPWDSSTTEPPQFQAADCHCPACRKFHVAAFVSYVVISSPCTGKKTTKNHDHRQHHHGDSTSSLVTIRGRENLSVYQDDSCAQVGPVDRWYCQQCFSKLFSQIRTPTTIAKTADPQGSMILLNMGPIVDETVPSTLLVSWRGNRAQWETPSKAFWIDDDSCGRPMQQQQEQQQHRIEKDQFLVRGSCACQSCRYEIDWSSSPTTEVHHCYCRLCRQLSGGPFQSWIPVHKRNMRWSLTDTLGKTTNFMGTELPPSSSPLTLRRTTLHAQRHCCQDCGSAMTIVYDGQPNHIWPAAGGLDDHDANNQPAVQVSRWKEQIHRVVHICCRYKQEWYDLPNDGLDRKHLYDWSFQGFFSSQSRFEDFPILGMILQLWTQYRAVWLLLKGAVVYIPALPTIMAPFFALRDFYYLQEEQQHQPKSLLSSACHTTDSSSVSRRSTIVAASA